MKAVEIATTTGGKLRFPTIETAKLGNILESRASQMLSGAKKAINLPAWEKLSFRIDPGETKPHFITGHKAGESRVVTSSSMGGKKTIFPEWMTEEQIFNAIKDAYKNSTKAKSTKNWDVGRMVTLEGYSKKYNMNIRIYLNADILQIDSAFPIIK